MPDPSKGTKGENASGITDAQGQFTLRAGRTGQAGVTPGFYRVVVTDLAGVPDPQQCRTLRLSARASTRRRKVANRTGRACPRCTPTRPRRRCQIVEIRSGEPVINLSLQSTR